MPSPESASRAQGYSEEELAIIEKQLNQHPDRTIEDWREIAHAAGKLPTTGGKSVSFAPESTTEECTMGADDDDDGQSLEHVPDHQANNTDALADETNNNNEVTGYRLNEDVEPGEADFNNDGFLNQNVNTEMRDRFQAFCKEAKQHWFPHIKPVEARCLRLLHILHEKSRALDTYDDVLLWYF
jgi:hypothetical protein